MKTLKLKISNEVEIQEQIFPYLFQYTGMFQKFYKHKLDCNKQELLLRFNLLDVSIYESCKIDAQTKIKQQEIIKNNIKKEITEIKSQLLKLNEQQIDSNKNIKYTKKFNKRTKTKRLIYKLNQKLSKLKSSIKVDITFGGKSLLKKISYQSNLKNTNSELYSENLHSQYLEEYKYKRLLPFYVVGRALDDGNRKFKFDFVNEVITFKPDRNTKIEIKYYANKNYKLELLKIQELVNQKLIPVTVTLSRDYICLSYDESLLKINHTSSTIKTKRERYLAIDLNPEEIGYCIVEKDNTKTDGFRVLYKELICLKGLNKRLNKSSSDKLQKKQNNKRRYEVSQVWKRVFTIANHYGVQCCIIEDLDFKKDKTLSNLTQKKSFNKQVNNIWHRELTTQLITKKCNESGIELRTINASYSSVIGNISYEDYDCIGASLELARRGINKYIKGNKLYPDVNQIHLDKLNYVLNGKFDKQVVNKTKINVKVDIRKIKSWKEIYGLLSYSGLRYRNKNKKLFKYGSLFLSEMNIQSHKSKVKALTYKDLCDKINKQLYFSMLILSQKVI